MKLSWPERRGVGGIITGGVDGGGGGGIWHIFCRCCPGLLAKECDCWGFGSGRDAWSSFSLCLFGYNSAEQDDVIHRDLWIFVIKRGNHKGKPYNMNRSKSHCFLLAQNEIVSHFGSQCLSPDQKIFIYICLIFNLFKVLILRVLEIIISQWICNKFSSKPIFNLQLGKCSCKRQFTNT